MKRVIQVVMVIGFIIGVLFFLYAFKENIFRNPKKLQQFIEQFGSFGVLVFIGMQIIQPIVPFIPGGLSDVAGILMFGNVLGLFYVCLGLIIGEVIAFLLVRKYGMAFLKVILSKKNLLKFQELLRKGDKNMLKILIIVFLMPFGPDDLACYAAGFSSMDFKKYLAALIVMKPISVGVHCYLSIYVFQLV